MIGTACISLGSRLSMTLDALGILVAEAGPKPARFQFRAMFEALLSLEYFRKDV